MDVTLTAIFEFLQIPLIYEDIFTVIYISVDTITRDVNILRVSYLRFDGLGHRCGYIHQISSPGLGHIEAKPLGVYEGIEGSSVADVDCDVTKTFHSHHHI